MQHLPLFMLECCFPAWEKPLSEKSSDWVGGDLLTLNEVATQILVLLFTCYFSSETFTNNNDRANILQALYKTWMLFSTI